MTPIRASLPTIASILMLLKFDPTNYVDSRSARVIIQPLVWTVRLEVSILTQRRNTWKLHGIWYKTQHTVTDSLLQETAALKTASLRRESIIFELRSV